MSICRRAVISSFGKKQFRQFRSAVVTKVPWCRCMTYDSFKRLIYRRKSAVCLFVFFSFSCSASLYWSASRAKVVDAVKPFNCAEARVSVKSHVWKRFGFPVWRNEEGEKATDRQKAIRRYCRSRSRTHLQHLFSAVCVLQSSSADL